jgi:hypothetical protein
MDMDLSFLDKEEFGIAKSFTTAPVSLIAPDINFHSAQNVDIEKQGEQEAANHEIRSDGFCFKLAPSQD